ncbi:hypothetical protein WB60_00065 [bacteria symbiont BFo2 of Frankliniella occidentalis]|nr:hypothetical protein WB60_00065 [bacteria symbiont BFo2 of Frankliniella occidentalis]
MAIFSDKSFEETYKQFLSIQAEWQEILIDTKVASDTDFDGVEFRHVGLTGDEKQLEKAKALIVKWYEFAAVCEEIRQQKQITILKETYAPLPYILEAEQDVFISRRPAYSSVDHPREALISRYDNLIKKFGTSKLAAALIKQLKQEREFFINQEPGSIYRLRSHGFTEISISHKNYGSTSFDRTQVGTHGALIFSRHFTKQTIEFKEQERTEAASIYDRMIPIPCSLFERGDLYSIEDIEFERKYREAHRFVHKSGITLKHGWKNREKEGRLKYRGTDKYPDFVARLNHLRPQRQYIIEQDMILVERMREIGEFQSNSIVDIRARFLLDNELATGYYPKTVNTRRQELIDQGIPLYQDIIKDAKGNESDKD